MGWVQAEYIWLDGNNPQELRSKTKIILGPKQLLNSKLVPQWGFDGSSTSQAEDHDSDCPLKPVRVWRDPLRSEPNLLVLCEVLNQDGSVHPTNARAQLADLVRRFQDDEPWVGVEQEYTLYVIDQPLGFARQKGRPKPQGPYYCGVGADVAFGTLLKERHTDACLKVGLHIAGTNAEVMPGQWEFQIGPRDSGDPLNPLLAADELWLARYLLKRISEDLGITISFAPKPVEGDWNGAGAHTNFSTKAMRSENGLAAVRKAVQKLARCHREHMTVYGVGNEKRLTGKHETCDINTFRVGDRDRGASVRIPMATLNAGRGYLEDRRPAANMNPYNVFAALLETICGTGFNPYQSIPTEVVGG